MHFNSYLTFYKRYILKGWGSAFLKNWDREMNFTLKKKVIDNVKTFLDLNRRKKGGRKNECWFNLLYEFVSLTTKKYFKL